MTGVVQVSKKNTFAAVVALHEGSEFEKGRARDSNLDTYTALRMGEVPELEVEFMQSTEVPTELGEPATIVVGPATFAAVGARIRHLPIRPAAVLQAIRAAA